MSLTSCNIVGLAMRKRNEKQLYEIQKILTTLKMGMNKELRKLSTKQKLAMLSFGNIFLPFHFAGKTDTLR